VADKGNEIPTTFDCDGETLVGVLHLPPSPPSVGVVIVVGGPQYRVGSHRQFVMLARDLARRGIAALRFDCRGMGDSDGAFPGFENIEPDVAAAVKALFAQVPSVRRVALWGLCDATLAIADYARHDPRVDGVVLLNPWVRSEAGLARAQLKHYYLARLMQPDFFRKILRGEFNPIAAAKSLLGNVARAFGTQTGAGQEVSGDGVSNALAERLAVALQAFKGDILVILSGRDLTAKEFDDAARGSKRWRRLFAETRLTRRDFAAADHTFSRRSWRDEVASWTCAWIEKGEAAAQPLSRDQPR
jgi:exosortase A-associated hydrolase 1